MSKFGGTNYITAPKNSVGVARHQVYYTNDQYDKRNKSSRGYKNGGFMASRQNRSVSDAKKTLTQERIKVVKQMLQNEKKVSTVIFRTI